MEVKALRSLTELKEAFDRMRCCLVLDTWNLGLSPDLLKEPEQAAEAWLRTFGSAPKRGDVFAYLIGPQEAGHLEPDRLIDGVLWWLGFSFPEAKGVYGLERDSWSFLLHPEDLTGGRTAFRPAQLRETWHQVLLFLGDGRRERRS